MRRTIQSAITASTAIICLCAGNAHGQAPAAAPVKTWADSVTVKGDIRFRYEAINDDSKLDADKKTYTRERDRIRARLAAEAKCNDNVKAGIELSTGQSDPVSGNQTIGDGFNKKDMKLNLAYLDYNFLGDDPTEVHAIAGKMKNPFMTMPDDLTWDGDATPEGIAFKVQMPAGIATIYGNAGYLWLQERSDRDDAMLYAGQAAVKLQFAPEIALTIGGSYYSGQSIEGYDVIDWESKNNAYGNSSTAGTVSGSTTNKAWASDFTPVVGFVQLDVWAAATPISLFAQMVENGDADDLKSGQMYGISIGKAKNPKTWELGYSYAELDKNAVIGFLTDSDRWGGGTDGKGHKFTGKYQIMKNLQAGVAYFLNEKPISDASKTKDYDRLQVDLVASF